MVFSEEKFEQATHKDTKRTSMLFQGRPPSQMISQPILMDSTDSLTTHNCFSVHNPLLKLLYIFSLFAAFFIRLHIKNIKEEDRQIHTHRHHPPDLGSDMSVSPSRYHDWLWEKAHLHNNISKTTLLMARGITQLKKQLFWRQFPLRLLSFCYKPKQYE